jgi:gamma-glutamyl-gamma-aminobutyrate hydrolase PuuD
MIRVALPFGSGAYRKALNAADIQPVENVSTVAGLDGLLLTGGPDVDPASYGAPRHPKTEPPEHDRDSIEIALLREALDCDLPVLAICRGLQLLNTALGGTLVQHITGHRCPKQQAAHSIAIASRSRLGSILEVEEADEYMVNSRHHQCVDQVASGLVVAARAPDNVVEALELPGKRFVLAVQWHPEDRMGWPDRKLFEAFRDAAKLSGETRSDGRLTGCLEIAH